MGQVLRPVLRFFRVIVISPMLHTHLHHNTALIMRTREKAWEYSKFFQRAGSTGQETNSS